jgi:hypothetical protein
MDTKADNGGQLGYSSWRRWTWALIGVVLLLPLVAMQFTREVLWNGADFIAAAILLGGAALIFEVLIWKMRSTKHRLMSAAVLLIAVLLVWAHGAVGIV